MKTKSIMLEFAVFILCITFGWTGRSEASELSKSEMTATASDSYNLTWAHPANAIDGDLGTRWETRSSLPQWIQVDLGNWCLVDSIALYVPARGIKDFEVYVSNEPDPADWGDPVAVGQTLGDSSFYAVVFDETAQGRYLRIVAISTHYDKSETRLNEMNVYGSVAIALADLQTGSTRYTNSNKLEVATFPSFAGYDQYQFTGTNGQASAIDPEGWVSTNDVPPFVELPLPAPNTNLTLYAWFTNETASVELRPVYGRTVYTTNNPLAAVSAQLTRYIVPGETVLRLTFQDTADGGVPLDAGTTGGEYNGNPILFLTPGLSCPEDVTPGSPYVTLDATGIYAVTLTVTNEAGNVDSAVSEVTVEARTDPALYVSPEGDNSTGEDWASAFNDLSYAQYFAASNDTIYVAGRTFWLSNQIYWVQSHIRIAGGYEATETDPEALPGSRDPEQWPTLFARSADSEISHRIMHIDGAANITLEYVTLTGGSDQHGSGLLINNSQDVVLSGCIITDNRRRQGLSGLVSGGGIRAQSSSVTLTNCVVRGNRVDNNRGPSGGLAYGGAIWSDGTLTIRDSRIQNNDAWTSSDQDRPAGGQGGGIYFDGANLVLKNVLLADNDASGSGHGIRVQGGTVDIENASVVYQPGEGIRRVGGTVNVSNSIVWGNWNDIEGSVNVSFSNIGDTEYGGDNISADPLFEYGFYLADGSPCWGAGSDAAANLGMDAYVRNIQGDGYGSEDTVNLGYHYPAGFDLTYANLYVATDGDDEINSGLEAGSPLQTLTKALSLAREGSRIHVAPGLYSDATNGETFPLTVTDTPGLQILGTDAGNTVLDAAGAGPRVLAVARSHQSRIENLTLTGGNAIEGAGLRIDRSQRVALNGCVITDNSFTTGLGGTYRGGGALFSLSDVKLNDCVIRDNTIHNTRGGTPQGNTFGGGIWSDGFLTLVNCRVLDNMATKNRSNASCYGGGIGFSGRRLEMKNVFLAGNEAECLASPGSQTYGDGLHVGNVSDDRNLLVKPDIVEMANVTAADNQGEGVRRAVGTVNLLNSILWNNGDDLVGEIEMSHSIYGTGADVIDGGNNITANPLFADAGAGNYRLQPGSPAIDAGLNQAWMADATDLDGNPRIMMGTVDMGCYETIPPTGTVILLR